MRIGAPQRREWRAVFPPSALTFAPLGVAALVVIALMLVAKGAYVALLASVALLVVAGLLIRWPDAATSIFAILLYTNALGVAVQVHHFPFLLAAAFPVVVLGIPIARDLWRARLPVATSALPYILAYLVVEFVGALFAAVPEKSMLDGVVTFSLEGMLLYVLVTNAIRTPKVLQQVLWSLIVAGACMGALVAYQQYTGTYDNNYWGFARPDEGQEGFVIDFAAALRQRRLGGPLGEPNRFAQIMAALIPIALFQIQVSRARLAKLFLLGSLMLIGIGSALGFSRGAAVGLAVVVPVMLVLGRMDLRQLAVGALALAAVALAVPQYAIRLASLGTVAEIATTAGGPSVEDADSSTQGRITELVAGALMFADYPVLGVGPDMYPQHYNDYARIAGGRVRDGTRRAHSLPFQIAAENGMLGLAAMGAIIWVTLRDLLRARRRLAQGPRDLERLVTGVLLAALLYLVSSLFLHASYARYLWFLLALGGAAARVGMTAEAQPTEQLVRLVRVTARGPRVEGT